ncbi:MAG: hypothetical protein KAQ87_00070 [Candidatus Pacebacteria bacterium]|nr:hypothetical protein [Candidatus Paceibacterota bacterium]
MLSILPVDNSNIPPVPIEVFQERIRDVIEQKTGRRFTVEELQQMDIGDVERILGIEAKRPTKIGHNCPSLLYKFRSPESVAYNRAVINGLLMEEN